MNTALLDQISGEQTAATVATLAGDAFAGRRVGYYAIGVKSYGRAPTFLLATGHEQARSVVAALDGKLPETGVCTSNQESSQSGCCV